MCARDTVICERAKAHLHGGRAYQHKLALARRTPPLPHQRLGHVGLYYVQLYCLEKMHLRCHM